MQKRLSLEVPSLFLNGTWVDDGERNVTSNLKVETETDPNQFEDLDDTLNRIGRSIRLSTAAHLSARFTYVSPAATIGDDDNTQRAVDGGYFENSGALTAAEIVRLIDDTLQVRRILVYIQNSVEVKEMGAPRSKMPFGETNPLQRLVSYSLGVDPRALGLG